jgi:rhomboid family protein
MFVPLRDDAPRPRFAYATFTLVVLNVVIFLVQQLLPSAVADRLLYAGGAVPFECANFVDIKGTGLHSGALLPPPFTILTSMFLHGGIGHLLFNVWFLWIFGDNVEKAMGAAKFVVFYLLAGSLATAAQVVLTASSMVPIVGASGAIAGVLGAYFLLYPRARVEVLVLLPFFIQTIIVPAFLVLGIWFVWQLLAGNAHGSVAIWAHVWGFLVGALLCKLFARRVTSPAFARGPLWPRIAPESSSSPL